MNLFKKLGRIATGRDAETGERLSAGEHLKQLHSPSKSIFDKRQEKIVREAEETAARQQAEINKQLAALKAASNSPAPISLTAGLAPPGNETFSAPPKTGEEPLLGKKEWVQLGIGLAIALVSWKLST